MQLPVSVTYRDCSPAAGLDELIRAEAAKLERYFPRVQSCRVLVEKPQRAESGAFYHVRIDVSVPQGELIVRHEPSLHGELQDLEVARTRVEPRSARLHTDPERVVRDAFHRMRRCLQDYARKLRADVKTAARPAQTGRVSKLSLKSGDGFLEASGERQIYFHRNSVLQEGFGSLRVGSEVEFTEEQGEHGPQASTVRLRHPRRQRRESGRSVVVPAE